MPDMRFSDAAEVAGTWNHRDGYLMAEAFAVRTGIQLYAGTEVGRPDLPVVRVYRSEDEVKSPESVRTFSHAPVTLGHPSQDVTKDNWRELARGEVSTEAEWKDGKIKLPLIVKDAQAIKAIQDGSARELSAGYTCLLEFVDGVTPSGEKYDAVQKNIRVNHLALVPQGRAGAECRVGDSAASWGPIPVSDNQPKPNKEEPVMTTVPVVLGDKAVLVPQDQAQAVQAFADATRDRIKQLETEHATALATRDAALATVTAERDAARAAQVTDAQLDAKVAERATLIDTAKRILPSVATNGSAAEIRKAVVVSKFGDTAKDKSEAYYDAAFDILAKDLKPADSFADAMRGQQPAPSFGQPVAHNVTDINALAAGAATAQAKRMAEMNNAWNPNANKRTEMGA